jgi:uncharacterized protein YdaU (DUF1376 family)
MHYYQFHIGDFIKDSAHLSLDEEAIYRRLIDHYYTTERPIELDIKSVSRAIRARGREDLIEIILSEFFVKTAKGFKQKRIDAEIKKYKEKSKKASKSAKARWDAPFKPTKNNANAMRTHSEGNANHKPLTNNHKPINNTKDNDEFELVWSLYERKGNKKTSKAKFIKLSGEYRGAMLKHIPDYVLSTPDKQYRKNLETYINQECWNDEVHHETSRQSNKPISAVDKVRVANEQRERERQIKYGPTGEGMGQALAATNGNIRSPASESIRGYDAGELGTVIDGDFSRAD